MWRNGALLVERGIRSIYNNAFKYAYFFEEQIGDLFKG